MKKKRKKEEKVREEVRLYRRKKSDWDFERKMSDWDANLEMNEEFATKEHLIDEWKRDYLISIDDEELDDEFDHLIDEEQMI